MEFQKGQVLIQNRWLLRCPPPRYESQVMTDSKTHFLSLAPSIKRHVHVLLCENAAEQWAEFLKSNSVEYVETVTGTSQKLDFGLLLEALDAVRRSDDKSQVGRRFLEPLAALQDGDLSLPEYVEFAFHSICNLYRKYVDQEPVDDWLIVNQALASIPTAELAKYSLAEAIRRAELALCSD